jgi:arylformamidase
LTQEKPRLFDITPLVSEKIGVFPGDVPFSREVSLDFKTGANLLLSSIRTTLHVGAHADGPNHYTPKGEGIGSRDPWLYMGRCLVVEAKVPRGERVSFEHLSEKWRAPVAKLPARRILVKTGSFPDPNRWNPDFCSLSPELIETWAKAGCRLIGIDTPSIDPETAKVLEAHQAVARNDLAVLEGLVLDQVPEGLYTLIALPLKLENADAAPVRAVLVDDAELFES